MPVVVDTSEWVPKWPRGGAVRFENVVMGYRPGLPDVLKGLSFACLEGEKVGVVGRTGSGKSSVMVSLFRFVELRSGVITVDGQDIKSLRLSQLRSSLSIIPQDPVMFSASLRFNLDPFEQHTDAELWEVIDKVSAPKIKNNCLHSELFLFYALFADCGVKQPLLPLFWFE